MQASDFLGEGGSHPLFRGAEGHGNGAHPHHLPAGADALAAQDTPGRGVPFVKAGFVDAHGRGHLLEMFRRRRLGQEEFQHHAPGGQDLLRRGLHHQAGLHRIGAGIHQAGAGAAPISTTHRRQWPSGLSSGW